MAPRPLLTAPLQLPSHSAHEAQCLIVGPDRRIFCNRPLRQILHALFGTLAPQQAKKYRRRFWRHIMPTAAASAYTSQRVHGQFHLVVGAQRFVFTLECRPILGRKRHDRGTHCYLVAQGPADAALAQPALGESALSPSTQTTTCPWPMYHLDGSGRFTWLNDAMSHDHGVTLAQLHLAPQSILHPDDKALATSLWHEAKQHGRPMQAFLRLRLCDATYRTCMVRINPCCDAAGHVLGWVGTHIEVARHEWLEALSACDDHESIGNSFLTVASHELRTPLTSLQLNLQLALQRLQRPSGSAPGAGAAIESMVARSLKQTHRLIEVVSDILDASRIHHGKLQLRHTDVQLNQLILETLALFDRPFAEVGCRVTVHLMEGVRGHWDRGRIEQVLYDLLVNVLKHAPGSHVTVATRLKNQMVDIIVADDGPGIPSLMHDKIFGRFGRATECRGISGLGLGLYLCRQIIDDHGGTLNVSSEEGQGATFVAKLPVTAPLAMPLRAPLTSPLLSPQTPRKRSRLQRSDRSS